MFPFDDDEQLHSPLPANVEAEQAVLGACIIAKTALEEVKTNQKLVPNDFWRESHQAIFQAMLDVEKACKPVDMVTLTVHLQEQKKIDQAGGIEYLTRLANSVPSAANVDHYAAIVKEKSVLRQLICSHEKVAAASLKADANPWDIIAAQKDILRQLEVSAQQTGFFERSADVVERTIDQISKRAERGDEENPVTGVPSGYRDLDEMTTGFHGSELIILAARPAVGKTAFALNVAQNVAVRAGEPVAIFSLEMGAEQLVQRMLCAEGNIDANKLRTGKLDEDDWPKLMIAAGTIGDAPIFIDDTAGITVADIWAKCRRLKQQVGKLGLIVIDYLQLIQGRGRDRQQDVSEISRTLKIMARELDVPVIALSQLSRSVEKRQDKRPMLSDLRESGAIEQDADIVAFLYRDEYYNKDSEKKNVVEFIIAKQRSGPVGTVELAFLKNFNKFVDIPKQFTLFDQGA
ncbi:replicative DNA helicase [Tumebacillus algifaecis]|uniref:Replicative DNA helicase n=1 Tax=Tumebacillus algifaecis TaxID=1214604 RepID=A0A223D326_9BACL|nr:replicative DNA helicase [Tumebacillus algifaecis]ASS75797.1 replicative DNA helicase [Tumebacillus algifaecis]